VLIWCTSNVIDDVIVVEFPGGRYKVAVVQCVGDGRFSRLHEIVAAAS